jgi:CheY-like chemotaxis protein
MKTILIVDDEPLIAMALEAALEDEGYGVSTAANGLQGLDRLDREPRPDLVLMDIMMPVMNGIAMLGEMSARPELCAIPVIILTSIPRESIAASKANVVGMMRKPFSLIELLGKIEDVIGKAGPSAS